MQDQGTPQQMTTPPADQVDGYAATLRHRFRDAPEFTTPSEFAAAFSEVLVGWGQSQPLAEQEARFKRLANLHEVATLSNAAGSELARHFMLLDALTVRFARHVATVDPNKGDRPERVAKWVDLTIKASKEARRCLAAAVLISQDLKVVSVSQHQSLMASAETASTNDLTR